MYVHHLQERGNRASFVRTSKLQTYSTPTTCKQVDRHSADVTLAHGVAMWLWQLKSPADGTNARTRPLPSALEYMYLGMGVYNVATGTALVWMGTEKRLCERERANRVQGGMGPHGEQG